jgi:hypothetical protein
MTDPLIVSRRDQHLECSKIIGRLNVKLSSGQMEFIGIPCTKPRLHLDACEFVGVELLITRRRRGDGSDIIYPRGHPQQ